MLKNKIKKLIDLIKNTEIEEIEVSSFWGAQKIRLSKSKDDQNIASPSNIDKKNQNESIATENLNKATNTDDIKDTVSDVKKVDDSNISIDDNYDDQSKFKIITAPLVGTFYSSPKPEDPSFINVGDKVEAGMVVCIIEAMKIFNDIESELNGELVHTYLENGTPVEYGQDLFVLRIDNV